MSAIVDKVLSKRSNWAEHKLSEIGTFIRGLSYDTGAVTTNTNATMVLRSNNIESGYAVNYENDVVYVDKDISKDQQLQENDIVICMANGSSSLVGKASYFDGSYKGVITVGAFCGIYRTKNPLIRWIFSSKNYQKGIFNAMQGGNGAIANLHSGDVLNLKFYFPSNNQEEFKLVSFLSLLDLKMKKDSALLEKYIKQKHFMLSKMFI